MKKHTFKRCAAVFAACAMMTFPMTGMSLSSNAADDVTKWGDANCDGTVDMGDAVILMQALANPNKYGIDGTAEHHLTEQGKINGDMNGDGLTVGDAQAIQKVLLGLGIN